MRERFRLLFCDLPNCRIAPPRTCGGGRRHSFCSQEAADRLCFHRVSDNHESHSVHQPAYLAECEHVCLSAGLEELDLQRSLANPVVLSHELVEAALPEQAVPVLVHVHAV